METWIICIALCCGVLNMDVGNSIRLDEEFNIDHNQSMQMQTDNNLIASVLKKRIKHEVVGGNAAIHRPLVGESNRDGVFDTTRHVPWHAGIRLVRAGGASSAHCGGTILTRDRILTAAHCFTLTKDVNQYIVRVGDLDNTVKERDEQEYKVSRIITHPRFQRTSIGGYDYDIALIALRRDNNRGIQFGHNVKPAYMPSSKSPVFPLSSCLISGWGRTSTVIGSGGTNILQVAKVKVLDKEEQEQCNRLYSGTLTSRMLCAGYTDGTKIDTCAGDSGGPLVCKIKEYHTVVGITSWGTTACAVTGYPGVYTNVQEMLPWIISQ